MSVEVEQWLQEANGFYEADQPEKAVQASDAVLKREPANLSALWIRTNALIRLGRTDDAIASYDVAATTDPATAATLLMRKSDQLEWLGRLDEALEAVSRAVELEPHDTGYRGQYVSLLRRTGRLEEGLSACEGLLRQGTESRSDWIEVKAGILRDLKRFDEAFKILSE
jgi:tetratricopeptide (TPR) repeat protein